MIHKTAAFLGASLLALASPAFADDLQHHDVRAEATDTLQSADTAGAPAAALPTISFGKWGFDPAYIATDIKPGDDFNAYANKRWIDANPLPPEFSRIGAFVLLGEKSTADVKALIDEFAAKDPAALSADQKRILDAYRTFLDTDAIEARGLAPAAPYLQRIYGATSLDKLAALWAEPGFASPLSAGVTIDSKQPDRQIAAVGFGGLGMPDRDYYLDTTEKGLAIQAKYKAYIAFLLGEAGYRDPQAAAEAVYAFEEAIARGISWDRTVRRNRDLTYNLLSAEELSAIAGKVPVAAMLSLIGIAKSPGFLVSLMPPSAQEIAANKIDPETLAKIGSGLPGMFDLLGKTSPATLQAWMVKEFLSETPPPCPSASMTRGSPSMARPCKARRSSARAGNAPSARPRT